MSGLSQPARTRNLLLVAAGALLVVLLVVVAVVATGGKRSPSAAGSTAAPSITQAAPAALKPAISSFDPSAGGSGFSLKRGLWKTQIYNTPTFGNLKDGVGLVLDLGSAKSVSAVSFNAGAGPLRVELRAGDTAGGSEDYLKVSESASASGKTTLQGADGGKHQYWMIWVTKLGGSNDAKISAITVTGS